jgi:drug/metabolite transporter (DMT)-like permease
MIILNEELCGVQLIGCAVVLLGIYLAEKAKAAVVM